MKTIRHPNCVFFYGAGVLPDEAPFLVGQIGLGSAWSLRFSQELLRTCNCYR
eukprot:m.211513 g.211513  ORF g.211513 m.211513 type:complete len:52 (+) comp10746_c0_seq20:3044-3199(+)